MSNTAQGQDIGIVKQGMATAAGGDHDGASYDGNQQPPLDNKDKPVSSSSSGNQNENEYAEDSEKQQSVKDKQKKKKKEKGAKDEETDPFEHLPAEEAEVLRRQIHVEQPHVSYMTLYRYATKFDVFLLVIGYVSSIIAGACLPLFTLVFGSLTQKFSDFFTSPNPDPNEFQNSINDSTKYFVYLGLGMIVFTWIDTYLHVNRGEVLSSRIRQHYLASVLRQNVAYFDKLGAGEVTTRITNDTSKIQEGISEKAGLIVNGIASFVCAMVVGFVRSWKLALILLSVVVTIIMILGLGSIFIIKYTTKGTTAYGEGSSVAEETLSAIRNTVAFGSQTRLLKKFDHVLLDTLYWSVRKGLVLTLMVAGLWSVIYLAYALAFWQGSRFVASGDMDVGKIVSVIMSMMIGAFVLGGIAPAFQAVGTALASAGKIFEAIDRVPHVDSFSDEGIKKEYLDGDIELKDVKFIYPSRPDVTVLPNMSLKIKSGQTCALVGTSGSGKSTIVGLIERFYDPVRGNVYIDGEDIANLNVRWLRQQIALVSQEPTLFAVSIFENICYGLIGTEHEDAPEEKKRELVMEACKQANAWDFIQSMTDGLDTNVGDRGFLMSGGQKQRIAIARAIISNPKILLLDEATSALDTKSEGVVQEALDRAAKSRTTIVIAHRLSTIKDADKIVVMSRGEIVETGTHNELLAKEAAYAKLVEAQKIQAAKREEYQEQMGSESDDEHVPENFTTDDLEKMSTGRSLEKTATGKSVSSQVLEGRQTATDSTPRSVFYLIKLLYQFNKNEKWYIVTGFCGALFCGFGYPALSMLFGKVITSIMVTPDQYPQMRKDINMYTGFFFMVGMLLFGGYLTMVGSFTVASNRLVRNIRWHVFQQYLRMDIAFFDEEKNSTGSLTSTLAKDAQSVEGLGGATLGHILQSVVTLVGGIIVGISFNWRLGLVCFATVPVLVTCGFARVWVIMKLETRAKKGYESSGSYACESIAAVRTVASLTREHGVWKTYEAQVREQVKNSRMNVLRSAILFGFSHGLTPWVMGLGFWYGSTLLKDGKATPFQFFVAFSAIVFGAQSAGQIFSYSPDMGKARQAAQNISDILDKQPQIDAWSQEGQVLDENTVRGDIEFKNIHFRYPTRPNVPVLRGLNLTIKKGQYVALVGASGCGKSTTISLVERFYDPLSGEVTMDGVDVKQLNINEYRKHIALVQQEPVLYSGSIRENILLGTNNEQVTEQDMFAASKKANIHDFVMSLPEGYDTYCGSKGALLSGGQKQRIAIARALIREPKVLLLDEATSALDSESEKVVQAALDEAAKGRTTIAVAHRLSTIQNADVIYVFEEGKICEAGTHQELLRERGKYFELVQMQSLDEK